MPAPSSATHVLSMQEADTSRRTELLPWADEVLVGREELSSLRGTVEELQDQVHDGAYGGTLAVGHARNYHEVPVHSLGE